MLKILAATVVMGVVLFIVNELVIGQMSALLAILVDIIVAVVVYGILLLLLGELTEQDIMRIPVIGRRLVQLLSLCGLCKKTV